MLIAASMNRAIRSGAAPGVGCLGEGGLDRVLVIVSLVLFSKHRLGPSDALSTGNLDVIGERHRAGGQAAGGYPEMTEKWLTSVYSTSATALAALRQVAFPDAQRFLDVTWGRGVFWKGSKVDVVGLDSNKSCARTVWGDLRQLPFRDSSFDVGVIDPPFLQGGVSGSTYSPRYGVWGKSVESLLNFYLDGMSELRRTCCLGAIAKVQDSVSSGKFKPLLAWLIAGVAENFGVWPQDMAVIISRGAMHWPGWHNQQHLRKTHSYMVGWRWTSIRR